MEDSIAIKKTKDWYAMLSPLAKVEFIEYIYKNDRHKFEYAQMGESLRRFHNPSMTRPTHQEEQ